MLEIVAVILISFALALLLQWFDRKLYADFQHRVGPLVAGPRGILQPLADLIKLLSKEQILPKGSDEDVIKLSAILSVALGFFALLFIPMYSVRGAITIEGDLLIVAAASIIIGLLTIVVGYSVASPYSNIGAARTAELIISYEIPFMLSVASVAVLAGSFRLSDIVSAQTGYLYFIALAPLGFICYIFSAIAKIEKVPFDIPEAETEIAAGWQTELSGRLLAMFRLALDLKYLLVSALGAVLFLGGPQPFLSFRPAGFAMFFVKLLVVAFLITLIRSIVARYRVDQALNLFWKFIIPLSVTQLAASILIKSVGLV